VLAVNPLVSGLIRPNEGLVVEQIGTLSLVVAPLLVRTSSGVLTLRANQAVLLLRALFSPYILAVRAHGWPVLGEATSGVVGRNTSVGCDAAVQVFNVLDLLGGVGSEDALASCVELPKLAARVMRA